MKKILILFAISLCSLTAMANGVEIDGIHYILDNDNHTACVTYTGDYYYLDNTYSGGVDIPEGFYYDGLWYDVTSIDDRAFYRCLDLTAIVIPESVTSIGYSAFSLCSNLTSVIILEGVTCIGESAFSACSGLTTIDIPNSVMSIGESALSACSGLTTIVVEQGNAIYDSRNDCNAIIETASNALLFGCQNTVIPSSVTSIGDDAFSRCSGLTSITIPNSVTSIGGLAFSNCSGLTSIVVEQGNAIYDSRNDCNAIIETASNTLISGCQNTLIPNSVTSIGGGAFKGCSNLKTMIIPEGVTSIGDGAFYGCSDMTSVTIPESVSSIGMLAFMGCELMEEVHISDLKSWCEVVIDTVMSSPLYYAQHLFLNGEEITNLIIPEDVESIGACAFEGCLGLTSVTIPNSVNSVGYSAFAGCSSLTAVKLSHSMSTIEENVFSNCYSLTSITIPNSVTNIYYHAFCGCYGLTSITCHASIPPFLGNYVFAYVPYNITLYVPYSSIPAYQAADQWGEFNIQPLVVFVDPITPNTIEMTWNPVDSASLYQLHLYTDSTSSIALDTTLLINADSLNGGIIVQPGTSVARRGKKIIQDDHGSIVIIIVDPTSGTSADNPYKVTVSTESGERIDVHFDMTVFQGTEILREESGTFVLNESVAPMSVENILAPSLPTGIYDLYGHRYPVASWPSLPAGVYVLRDGEKMTKVMRK